MASLLGSPPMPSILLNAADEYAGLAPLNPIARSCSLPSQARRPRRPSSPQRRIKFAPLPDPRKNVLVTDDGEELPLPAVFDTEENPPSLATFPPSPTAADTTPTTTFGYSISPSASRNNSSTELARAHGGSVSAPASPRASRRRQHSPARDQANFAKKLLRPFRSSRSPSRSRSSSGTESTASSPNTPRNDSFLHPWGAPLARWTSAGSASSDKTTLARTTSRDSQGAKGGARLMLNGRMYGARRPSHSRGQEEYREPEFVEWGQGGMGAVRDPTAKHWGRLQGQDPLRGRSGSEGGDREDEDDGSGMAWLRRRRAEREAAKQKEHEKQGDAGGSSASSTTSEKSSETGEGEGDGGADTDVTAPDAEEEREQHEHDVKKVVVGRRESNESSSEDDEEGSGEEEQEREKDEDDAEVEGDEDEDDAARKTALGAGVEKISRHHH